MEEPVSSPPLPLPESTITSLEALKVISDPFRQQLLSKLGGIPRTVKELAAEVGLSYTRLYYHINLLEEHHLIRVTHTRLVSGILEKHYQATAYSFLVDRTLLTLKVAQRNEGLEAVLDYVLRQTATDIQASVQSGSVDLSQTAPDLQALLARRRVVHISPEKAQSVYCRLTELLTELLSENPGPEDHPMPYALALAFYPTQPTSTGDNSYG
ncbi:winged helix-turn-helix domain-containing protein [Anthocerotibacter panamensis]|uniref:winged helix-turn-helix domain-containing protein n=1 Tax=Anthocerotibacter panamensis TaxID=2857077 RepID=UPI001C407F0E|nr:winged helix-turn-helix domain-containing protein [Anthocerotibacter panamensis]